MSGVKGTQIVPDHWLTDKKPRQARLAEFLWAAAQVVKGEQDLGDFLDCWTAWCQHFLHYLVSDWHTSDALIAAILLWRDEKCTKQGLEALRALSSISDAKAELRLSPNKWDTPSPNNPYLQPSGSKTCSGWT